MPVERLNEIKQQISALTLGEKEDLVAFLHEQVNKDKEVEAVGSEASNGRQDEPDPYRRRRLVAQASFANTSIAAPNSQATEEASFIVPASLEEAWREVSAVETCNPWPYAVAAGLIGLAFTSAPGGLAGWQGYLLGFVSVFLFFGLLELGARRYFPGAAQ
jgi:hypothetical protein